MTTPETEHWSASLRCWVAIGSLQLVVYNLVVDIITQHNRFFA
ncbi:hypothetical protein WQQ_44940 [Hydrocarboniphaga effusa AP103]|jgi:hypothetical protein|uniref:Uncharacterized protein n=1 Tax=Hydrocarboniphaga effusa AP103 TaxID=1172194 RepID=I7Z8C9_9GAMM|nr:hypothetical protein WQQ_44940 [Hydrocarboniphaga effusa AP103]